MSHGYYGELWLVARIDLEKLLVLDRTIQGQRRTRRREDGLNLMIPTYLRYRNLVKRLIVCHDQMVQTQKRDVVKRILDCAVGRMLEYKQEIVKLEHSDYQWPDDFMKQLKYTPDNVEITVSAMGKDLVEQRKKYFQELIEKAHKLAEAKLEEETSVPEIETITESQESTPRFRRRNIKEESTVSEVPSILQRSSEELAAEEARTAAEQTMRDAMLLVQSHERARIGRRVGADVQRMYNYKKKVENGEIVPKKISWASYESAARTIQRAWNRHVAKKATKKRISRVEELLGMTIPSWKPREVFLKDNENFRRKLLLMPTYAARVAETTEKQRTKLWKIRGPGLIEDISDEIREWFLVWYNETGHFNAYPAAHLGGSVLIATGQTLTPQEYLAQKASKQSTKGKQQSAAASKAQSKKGGRSKRKRPAWMPETKAFSLLDTANQDFIHNWSFRDNSDNSQEKIYVDLITDKLCHELQLEMRQIVDELMRLELGQLNRALKSDYAADNKKIHIPKDKSRKKRRKKKKKDPLGGVAVENLFNELAQANIIRHYPITSLKDWVGDLSYQNYEAARESREYKHRLGEIKQVVMENCILPFSSRDIHQIAPLIRSVCICGLARSGKSFLVNAICSEVGALLLDMTPSVLVDKYVGPRNERKLINMISKVAREYSPSVIFIDNGEKPWAKRVPPEDLYYKPKRFAKYYLRLVKSIKRGDQILFLTTSSEPYKARRPFIRIHDKFITIPLTDYNTLYMFYKDLLMKYHGVDRDIDISGLAKMSVGIPLEFIKNAVENVLNLRRRITLRFNPLSVFEIMEELLNYQPPSRKTFSRFEGFEYKTPLGRRRRRLLAREEAEQQRMAQMKRPRK